MPRVPPALKIPPVLPMVTSPDTVSSVLAELTG